MSKKEEPKTCPHCGHSLLSGDLNQDMTKEVWYCSNEDCPIAPKNQYHKEYDMQILNTKYCDPEFEMICRNDECKATHYYKELEISNTNEISNEEIDSAKEAGKKIAEMVLGKDASTKCDMHGAVNYVTQEGLVCGECHELVESSNKQELQISNTCNSCGIEFDYASHTCTTCAKTHCNAICLTNHINNTKNHTLQLPNTCLECGSGTKSEYMCKNVYSVCKNCCMCCDAEIRISNTDKAGPKGYYVVYCGECHEGVKIPKKDFPSSIRNPTIECIDHNTDPKSKEDKLSRISYMPHCPKCTQDTFVVGKGIKKKDNRWDYYCRACEIDFATWGHVFV